MFAIIEEKVNAKNVGDVQNFQRLCRLEKQKGELSTANKKTLSRLQTRLHKDGVIRPISRAELVAKARAAYHAMWFWQRWGLKLRYLKRRLYMWWVNRGKTKPDDA